MFEIFGSYFWKFRAQKRQQFLNQREPQKNARAGFRGDYQAIAV
jgi:hypothetical protein